MGKKKKGKAQKYAKVSDENNTKTSAKKEQQNGKPRRSKRRKRPVENSESLDDYKFRQEIEGMSIPMHVNVNEYTAPFSHHLFSHTENRRLKPNNRQY